MDISNLKNFGSVATACLVLAACGGSGDSSDSDAEGRLSLAITDAPIYQADLVEIDVTGVEVKPQSGPVRIYSICENPVVATDPPVAVEGDCPGINSADILTIDLLQYTNGASFTVLDDVVLPAGRVNWVRLRLADPAGRIKVPMGAVEDLTVPSADQTGLKLNRGFDVPEGGLISLTIDFDVRKSIVEDANGFKLKPTLRLVEVYGAIAGDVHASLLVPECLGPSIYVFAGDTTPDDIDRDDGDPVSSAMVDDTDGSYRVDFLPPGEYTAAFVCAEGGPASEPEDNPDLDDAVSFTPADGKPATVVVDQTFPLDFP